MRSGRYRQKPAKERGQQTIAESMLSFGLKVAICVVLASFLKANLTYAQFFESWFHRNPVLALGNLIIIVASLSIRDPVPREFFQFLGLGFWFLGGLLNSVFSV